MALLANVKTADWIIEASTWLTDIIEKNGVQQALILVVAGIIFYIIKESSWSFNFKRNSK